MGLDKRKATKPGTKQGTNQALLLLAAAGGLLAIVVVGIIVIVALRGGSSGASGGSPGPRLGRESGVRTAGERRMVLEEWRADDQARVDAFKRLLKDEGHKCSAIERAAMVSAGVWTVLCAPGNVYRLTFNDKAGLKEITKLQ